MREAGSDDAQVKRDEKRTNLVKGEKLMKYQKLYTLLYEATYNQDGVIHDVNDETEISQEYYRR